MIRDEQWRMVKTRGSQFVIGDKPFYVNGFNAYWLMILAVDPSTRGKVTEVFQQVAAVGLTVCAAPGASTTVAGERFRSRLLCMKRMYSR